jgi:hypothetical protein
MTTFTPVRGNILGNPRWTDGSRFIEQHDTARFELLDGEGTRVSFHVSMSDAVQAAERMRLEVPPGTRMRHE